MPDRTECQCQPNPAETNQQTDAEPSRVHRSRPRGAHGDGKQPRATGIPIGTIPDLNKHLSANSKKGIQSTGRPAMPDGHRHRHRRRGQDSWLGRSGPGPASSSRRTETKSNTCARTGLASQNSQNEKSDLSDAEFHPPLPPPEEAEVGIVSPHRRVGLAGGKVGIPPVQIVRRSVQGRSVKVGSNYGARPFCVLSSCTRPFRKAHQNSNAPAAGRARHTLVLLVATCSRPT